jgi:hypothetical protein
VRLRQASPWNGFVHEFVGPTGHVMGTLRAPTYAQAKNARVAFHPKGSSEGDTRLDLQGVPYRVRHEYLRRGFNNDVRYTLETAAGEILCSADVTFESGRRLPAFRLTSPRAAEVMPSVSFWKKCFPIVDAAGARIGDIREPRALAMRLQYDIQLPDATPPLLAFLLTVTLFVRR